MSNHKSGAKEALENFLSPAWVMLGENAGLDLKGNGPGAASCHQVQPVVGLKMYSQSAHIEHTCIPHIHVYVAGHTDHNQALGALV